MHPNFTVQLLYSQRFWQFSRTPRFNRIRHLPLPIPFLPEIYRRREVGFGKTVITLVNKLKKLVGRPWNIDAAISVIDFFRLELGLVQKLRDTDILPFIFLFLLLFFEQEIWNRCIRRDARTYFVISDRKKGWQEFDLQLNRWKRNRCRIQR